MQGLCKVEGSGNDFLLGTGAWADRLGAEPELVSRLCHRRCGLGADGTLALFAEGSDRLRLIYRNADGSRAAFCANGTRCAARAGVELLGLPHQLVVVTDWVAVPAAVQGDRVAIELPAPPAPPRPVELGAGGSTWQGHLLEVGVPHLVITEVDDLAGLDLALLGPALGHHPQLPSPGANVTFLAADSPVAGTVRSWELGVEGETLSCGSGVVAAGLVALAASGGRSLQVRTQRGDLLQVEALGAPPQSPSRLTGSARFVAVVEPSPELLAEEEWRRRQHR